MFSWQRTVAASLALLVVLWAALAQQHRFASVISITDSDRSYKITTELRKFIEDVRQNGTIPGLSVALVQSTWYSGSTVDLEGFGDSTEAGAKVTPETLFSIASCSKAFLAGSLGILMDDFKNKRNVTSLPAGLEVFDWHTRLKDLLPQDWGMMDMWTHEKATVRDILTHVSGLPRHDLSYTASDSPVDVIRRMRHLRPSFELREKHQYINQMFVLATHIVALYSGTPYIEFVTQRILIPLRMSSSTFSEFEANETGLLSHAFNRDGRRIPFWFPDSVKVLTAGPGGIISNARDMARWIQMLLHEGVDPSTNKTILSRAVYQAMTSAHSVASPAPYPEFSDINYGFGWTRYSYQSHEVLQHSGAIPGYSTQIALLPRDGLGIVVLCNASQKENQAMAIVYRVIESILGLPRTASSRFTAAPQLPKSHVRSEPIASNNSHPPHSEKISKENMAHENVSLEKYVGTYTNPGYPNITLCSPTHAISLHELDKVCRDTLKEFSSFDDHSTIGLTLYLSIPGLWVRHARLRPAGHDRFNVASTYLFPEGYGRDKTPFELSEMIGFMGDVEFAVDDRGKVVGFGLDNSDVTVVPGRSRGGGDIKGTAGVWFNKA